MSKTLTVGCKLPNGLIIEVDGKTAVINGTNTSKVIGGHGITENVDADLFNAWIERNKERKVVKNELIFAHTQKESVKASATIKQV